MKSLLIIAAILTWSSLGVFVRYSGVPVQVLMFYALCFAIVIQSPLFLFPKFRTSIPCWRSFSFIGLLAFFNLVNTFTFLFAYARTTIANAVLTHYIAPVVVAVLAYIFLKEMLTGRILVSLALSSAGLWIMLGRAGHAVAVVNMSGRYSVSSDQTGIIAGLVSGFAYAAVVILIRAWTQKINPVVLVYLQNVIMAMMLLPFIHAVPLEKMWLFALSGLLHSTLAPFLYYEGLKFVKANSAAILGYFEPVGAIVLGILFLNEQPGLRALAGGGLILLSGYLIVSGNRKKPA